MSTNVPLWDNLGNNWTFRKKWSILGKPGDITPFQNKIFSHRDLLESRTWLRMNHSSLWWIEKKYMLCKYFPYEWLCCEFIGFFPPFQASCCNHCSSSCHCAFEPAFVRDRGRKSGKRWFIFWFLTLSQSTNVIFTLICLLISPKCLPSAAGLYVARQALSCLLTLDSSAQPLSLITVDQINSVLRYIAECSEESCCTTAKVTLLCLSWIQEVPHRPVCPAPRRPVLHTSVPQRRFRAPVPQRHVGPLSDPEC